jgi:hypothetical protein
MPDHHPRGDCAATLAGSFTPVDQCLDGTAKGNHLCLAGGVRSAHQADTHISIDPVTRHGI